MPAPVSFHPMVHRLEDAMNRRPRAVMQEKLGVYLSERAEFVLQR